MHSTPLSANPVLDFGIDRNSIRFIGEGLQRPECILAEPDGTIWSADARGGVVRIAPDATQQIIAQQQSEHFHDANTESSRYLQGTLPNGLAFARNGDFLISNFGTDRLELMTRDGRSKVLADHIDGLPIGKVNFVLRDSKDRVWITVSTRVTNWMHALRTDLADGFIARSACIQFVTRVDTVIQTRSFESRSTKLTLPIGRPSMWSASALAAVTGHQLEAVRAEFEIGNRRCGRTQPVGQRFRR